MYGGVLTLADSIARYETMEGTHWGRPLDTTAPARKSGFIPDERGRIQRVVHADRYLEVISPAKSNCGYCYSEKGPTTDGWLEIGPKKANGVSAPTNAVEYNGLIPWTSTSRHDRVGNLTL